MNESIIKCPICGDPYVVYSHYCGDQSACGDCRTKARSKEISITTDRTWPISLPKPFILDYKGYPGESELSKEVRKRQIKDELWRKYVVDHPNEGWPKEPDPPTMMNCCNSQCFQSAMDRHVTKSKEVVSNIPHHLRTIKSIYE